MCKKLAFRLEHEIFVHFNLNTIYMPIEYRVNALIIIRNPE